MTLNNPHYTTACIFTVSKMGIYGSLSILPFGIIFIILLYYNLNNNLGVMIFNMKDMAPLGIHIFKFYFSKSILVVIQTIVY